MIQFIKKDSAWRSCSISDLPDSRSWNDQPHPNLRLQGILKLTQPWHPLYRTIVTSQCTHIHPTSAHSCLPKIIRTCSLNCSSLTASQNQMNIHWISKLLTNKINEGNIKNTHGLFTVLDHLWQLRVSMISPPNYYYYYYYYYHYALKYWTSLATPLATVVRSPSHRRQFWHDLIRPCLKPQLWLQLRFRLHLSVWNLVSKGNVFQITNSA